jgi:hypothetical protein
LDINDYPMVRVTWKDALDSDGTWTDLEDILKHECVTCEDVGYLVVDDATKVIVMRSRIVSSEENTGSSYIAIPKSWVTEIDYLTTT